MLPLPLPCIYLFVSSNKNDSWNSRAILYIYLSFSLSFLLAAVCALYFASNLSKEKKKYWNSPGQNDENKDRDYGQKKLENKFKLLCVCLLPYVKQKGHKWPQLFTRYEKKERNICRIPTESSREIIKEEDFVTIAIRMGTFIHMASHFHRRKETQRIGNCHLKVIFYPPERNYTHTHRDSLTLHAKTKSRENRKIGLRFTKFYAQDWMICESKELETTFYSFLHASVLLLCEMVSLSWIERKWIVNFNPAQQANAPVLLQQK